MFYGGIRGLPFAEARQYRLAREFVFNWERKWKPQINVQNTAPDTHTQHQTLLHRWGLQKQAATSLSCDFSAAKQSRPAMQIFAKLRLGFWGLFATGSSEGTGAQPTILEHRSASGIEWHLVARLLPRNLFGN